MLSRQLAESILCARPATDCLDLLPRRSTQFPIEKQKMGLRELQNDAQPLHKKSDVLNVQGIKGLYQSLSYGSFVLVGSSRLALYG
jgi:hypothetical protein